MFTEVVKAEYVDGYRIRLWFNNQVTKVSDNLQSKWYELQKSLPDLQITPHSPAKIGKTQQATPLGKIGKQKTNQKNKQKTACFLG